MTLLALDASLCAAVIAALLSTLVLAMMAWEEAL
jgi:hypothetical protein